MDITNESRAIQNMKLIDLRMSIESEFLKFQPMADSEGISLASMISHNVPNLARINHHLVSSTLNFSIFEAISLRKDDLIDLRVSYQDTGTIKYLLEGCIDKQKKISSYSTHQNEVRRHGGDLMIVKNGKKNHLISLTVPIIESQWIKKIRTDFSGRKIALLAIDKKPAKLLAEMLSSRGASVVTLDDVSSDQIFDLAILPSSLPSLLNNARNKIKANSSLFFHLSNSKSTDPRIISRLMQSDVYSKVAGCFGEMLPTAISSKNPMVRALVVDDEKINRLLLVRMLACLGIEAKEACNGLEAIKIWKENPIFEVIFMDQSMPEMDGLIASKSLRELSCKAKIIALTSHSLKSDQDECIEAGINRVVSKPMRKEDLIDIIGVAAKGIENKD